ncbi:hypothetical protein GOP47_0016313 [Adiantum capillus-veneris]|uniref:Uncharacterized protein n=1 Tax=Adiantum capillus-veneris TaxID=13818 RepID=A0A9D4UIC8_ADICA|nr:hypothetical protein GOP47_0016313 [Adiantum capillus-veneris]
MRWGSCFLLISLLLASSNRWTFSPFSDVRSLPRDHQTLSLPAGSSKPGDWYPLSGAVFSWSRVAPREEAAEEKHPADKLLRRQKADMTESYILGGY